MTKGDRRLRHFIVEVIRVETRYRTPIAFEIRVKARTVADARTRALGTRRDLRVLGIREFVSASTTERW